MSYPLLVTGTDTGGPYGQECLTIDQSAATYTVSYVQIHNRQDECASRLGHFEL